MRHLLEGTSEQSKNFHNNIRSYNSALAFGSMVAQLDQPPGHGPYAFKIHGQVYHQISDIHPEPNEKPKYGQLYILDTDMALRERMGQAANENCDKAIMKKLDEILRINNPFAKSYKMMADIEKEEEQQSEQLNRSPQKLIMIFDETNKPTGKIQAKHYNTPTVSEVAAVFLAEDAEITTPYKIVVHQQGGGMKTISILDDNCDPLVYPLLFPGGDKGWHPNIKANKERKRQEISQLEFYSYRLAIRQEFSALHLSGKLFQQYLVDSYVKTEQNRLMWVRKNQDTLRAENYQGLADFVRSEAYAQGVNPGKITILPSTFPGSVRAMQQNYQDAMAIVTRLGKPDLFITMTCNPKWEKIQNHLLPGQRAEDRPDLVAKEFKSKLDALLDWILHKNIFGYCIALIYVIEFQKRGLPHAHILAILKEIFKPKTQKQIDAMISAELPNKEQDPELYDLVLKHMIHGPCGDMNKHAPCMEDGICTKNYPKTFENETEPNVDGYPIYRRRDTKTKAKVGKYTIDNRWVVPHNRRLLKELKAHINCEVCTSIKSVKYIFEYIYKGHDCAYIIIKTPDGNDGAPEPQLQHDEIKAYLDARYVCAPESVWRLLEYPMHYKTHAIIRLAVHLENMQMVHFHQGQEIPALKKAKNEDTTLTAWFKLNQKNEEAKQYLYHEIPEHFTFTADKKWKTRERREKIIGRMYTVSPQDIEKYHLRLLLLHTPGATSFSDIRKVDGVVHDTYQEAAKAKGLLADDEEWQRCMTDAVTFQMPSQLRHLFATILIFCDLKDAPALWDEFKGDLSQDFSRHWSENQATLMAWNKINDILQHQSKPKDLAKDYKIEKPVGQLQQETEPLNLQQHLERGNEMYSRLNQDQKQAADEILRSLNNQNTNQKCYFIDGPGGTGKTFLYEALYHLMIGNDKSVSTIAWTGIAANLLPNGRTVHNQFHLPVPILEESSCDLHPDTIDYIEVKQLDVIIWDEAPMAPRYAMEAIDRTLKDMMKTKTPFGGKLMILGGK